MDILETEIIKSADYAVKLAKEKFGVSLDYSVSSLKELDILLQRTNQYFQNSISSGKPVEDAVRKNSRLWGIYFGEVVRRNQGGIWVQRFNDFVSRLSRNVLMLAR
jgi:type IV secretory pathway ATPase VirB11/archaellum biosynthesis ATPase